jgi:hypothetical protein
MRPVTLGHRDVDADLREIERASHEGEMVEIAQNFSVNGPFVQTFILNTNPPTTTNIVAVLATFIQVLQRGGLNRTT